MPHDANTEGTSDALTPEQGAKALEGLLFPSKKREGSQDNSEREEDEPNESGESEQPEEEGGDADSEETEGDESEETEEEGEESDAEESEEPVYEVTIDGKPEKVTLSELQKGYSREAHFTRKSQAHAEEVKKFKTELEAPTRAALQKYTERLAEVEQTLKSLTPEEPKWDEIEEQLDPVEFLKLKDRWATHKDRLVKLADERRKNEEALFEQQMKDHADFVRAEAEKLKSVLPHWNDSAKAKAERDALVGYAESLGFQKDDLATVADHRIIVMLRKAMLYDKAQEKKPAPKSAPPERKSVKPGSTSNKPRGEKAETAALKSKLAKTGDPRVAAQLLERMI